MSTDNEFDYPEIETDFVEPPKWMLAGEYLELVALYDTVTTLHKPTFQWRGNWPSFRRLYANGFITWEKHPEMGRRFAAVDLTPAGRKLVEETRP